jgi:AcrR family transcriptional regulator
MLGTAHPLKTQALIRDFSGPESEREAISKAETGATRRFRQPNTLLDNTNGRAIMCAMTMRHPKTKVKRLRGVKTRESILKKAVSIASVEGLEGLTIGKLATELGISKSGLFAHFGSKEELQLAVVEAARLIFVDRVMRPAHSEKGMKRLRAFYENWISYADGKTFPGGCFFSAVSLEFDDRPGKIRDQVVKLMKMWLSILEETAREAQAAHEIKKDVDPHQLAFEMHALATAANWSSRLFQDKTAFGTARTAVLQRLEQVSTKSS